MSDDPMKLFVVVMAVLLAVLGFVAYQSWTQAAAYERALDSAEADAKNFREWGADVRKLCEQLRGTRLSGGKDPRPMFDDVARQNGIRLTSNRDDRNVRTIGGNVKEKRYIVELSRQQGTQPVPRDSVAKFCRDVERLSNGLLKTIEIDLRRATGKDQVEVGQSEFVAEDRYTFTIVFGYRFIE